ncbi:MAG: hypothetical protein J7562_04435 [Agrobacterium tumefaciens]|nr:hypothetical protein [Agrobacterium tumefaciens]
MRRQDVSRQRCQFFGGASADPIRFLGLFIRGPAGKIPLHRSGLQVVIPDPSRYALIHKLVVASCRHLAGQAGARVRILSRARDIPVSRTIYRRVSRAGLVALSVKHIHVFLQVTNSPFEV